MLPLSGGDERCVMQGSEAALYGSGEMKVQVRGPATVTGTPMATGCCRGTGGGRCGATFSAVRRTASRVVLRA